MTRRHIPIAGVIIALVLAAAQAAIASPPPPSLSSTAAKFYTTVALQRKFKNDFYEDGSRIVCSRVYRSRQRCKVSWYQGDTTFSGHTDIWTSWNGDVGMWNYSFTIIRVNTYCFQVQHRSLAACSKRYHVS